jgi:hypothetical protein
LNIYIKLDLTTTNNLFAQDGKPTKKPELQLTEKQQKDLDEKLDQILNDKTLTREEQTRKCLRIVNDTENEILANQCDGEISVDMYGNFQFKLYKDEEEDVTATSSEGVSKHIVLI